MYIIAYYKDYKQIIKMRNRRYITLDNEISSPKKQRFQRNSNQSISSIFPSLKSSGRIQIKKISQGNSLAEFHKQLEQKGQSRGLYKKIRSTSKKVRSITKTYQKESSLISSLKQQIAYIQDQLSQKRKQQRLKKTIQTLIQYNKQNYQTKVLPIACNQLHHCSPPLYNPCMHNQCHCLYRQFECRQKNVPEKEQSSIKKQFRRTKKFDVGVRRKRGPQLRRICRKVFFAVAYTIFLRNLSQKLIQKRKKHFKQLWPDNFRKSSYKIGQWIFSCCSHFFQQMLDKSYFDISIDLSLKGFVLSQRNYLIKSHLSNFVKCCKQLTKKPYFHNVCQLMHQFCKHGAQSSYCSLTVEQLQTVCISESHGYLSMDKLLQKSQIINFLFIKIIIYNIILQPWKYDKNRFSKENQQLYDNFVSFSSILYKIVKQIQRDYLFAKHPPVIKIGNWKILKDKFNIKPSKSLCRLNHYHEPGQMISGLVPESDIQQLFTIQYYREQKQILIDIIEQMHKRMCEAHQQFINREVYQYKKKNK